MNKYLRLFRIYFAAVIFILITANFLSIIKAPILLKTQFIPSFLGILNGSFIAFALLIIITLLFGRVYCSFLCPLGIYQDIVARVSNFIKKRLSKDKKKKREGYKKEHKVLRYSILIILSVIFICGITYPIALLDPYSIFGRIANNIFANIELWINNLLSGVFPTVFIKEGFVKFSLIAFIYSLFCLIVVTIFGAFKGRLYCNTICPVGTFLGAISGYALFKPVIDKDMCVKCTLCATNCKSNCINLETKEIDTTRCVACYNCLTSCKRGGVKLKPSFKRKENHKKEIESKERRVALIAMGGFAAALASRTLINKIIPGKETPDLKKTPILPPGALNINKFKDSCSSCHACIAACPNGVLKPASFEYGIDGVMLPTVIYDKASCKYDCNICSTICPQGAITPQTIEQKQKLVIGKARYIAKNCVVFKDDSKCGRCAMACKAKAIEMVPLKDNPKLKFPKLNKDKCIGCGACQVKCPALEKAFVVQGTLNQNYLI